MSVICKLPDSAAPDENVKYILANAKTVAVVGISTKEDSASHRVARYLQEHGFRMIGVNPNYGEVLGEKCYPDLKSIPEHVDVVDIFRKPDAIASIVEEAVEIGAGAVWMQLGLEHEEAAQTARQAGLSVVMNKCIKIEHARCFANGKTSDFPENGEPAQDEQIRFGKTGFEVSRLVQGTWVTGGWAWGGSDEKESLLAILRALELGINFIDTAPVYGFGKSEEIAGRAIRQWGRDKTTLATKCGLEWDERRRIRRNSNPERIMQEAEDSLRRLGVDCIDLYQIHWPDLDVPFEKSMQALLKLKEQGKIRFLGLSNFSGEQAVECLRTGPIYSLQPPYNIFEREAEKEILPFCIDSEIPTLVYGGLCRGLLTGKFTGNETFPKGDLRRNDPKFTRDHFKKYADAVNEIRAVAAGYGKTPAQFALRWAIQQPGVTCVIAGARTAKQAEDNAGALGWEIVPGDLKRVDEILAAHTGED